MTARTVGVEEEFLLLQADGPGLAETGKDVVAAASEADLSAQYEHELKRAQAELASRPTASLTDLAADLTRLRAGLARAASRRSVRVVAAGTNPTFERARTTVDERYRQMTDLFGQVAEQQLVCGMHVHVSVESEDEGVAAIDAMGPWLPVLTALAANSPFYAGRDTGYASYRRMLWGQWPSAGPTAAFGTATRYHRTLTDLVATGAARDEQMIYFDARLSPRYPTVEIRCCDVCARVADAVVIAGLARALLSTCAQRGPGGPVPLHLLRAASWRAARFGMADELVRLDGDLEPLLVPAWDLADELLELVGPALDATGDAGLVGEGLAEIRKRGTGADLQRGSAAVDGVDAVLAATSVDAATPPRDRTIASPDIATAERDPAWWSR